MQKTSFARPGFGLALFALVLAGSAFAESRLSSLAGEWLAPAETRDTGTLAVSGTPLPGGWLQLVVEETAVADRSGETIVLRETSAGAIDGYLFSFSGEAIRLAGTVNEDRLEIEAEESGRTWSWSWSFSSDCEASLSRGSGARLLKRSDCATGVLAERESTPETTSAPSEPPPSAEESGGETLTEIDVATLPVARAAQSPTVGASNQVLLAGRGKPLDEVHKAIERIGEFLADQGVAVEVPEDEIIVLQAADRSLAYLVREARDRGAASLLYVTAAFGGRERIVVDCYDQNGLLLWSEKTVGGTGMRQFKWMNPRLVERIQERLTQRLGGPGLPVAASATSEP